MFINNSKNGKLFENCLIYRKLSYKYLMKILMINDILFFNYNKISKTI